MLSDNHEKSEAANTSPFDAIRQLNDQGEEYWSARELARVLGYTEYGKFRNTIKKAEQAVEASGFVSAEHIAHVSDMITVGKGARRKVADVHLTRYGAYLVAMNADPSKEIVAQAQTYFARQTRRAELANAENFATLPENRQRLLLRGELRAQDDMLTQEASLRGVQTPQEHEAFQDAGYTGLYGGMDRAAIKAKKGIPASEDLLNHIGPDELISNLFRASQTAEKLRRDKVEGAAEAAATHQATGQKVREFISELGNTLPEDLPAAAPPIVELEAEEHKKLTSKGRQTKPLPQ